MTKALAVALLSLIYPLSAADGPWTIPLDSIHTISELLTISSAGDWKTAKDKDGIRISYRKLLIGDSIKTREIKVDLSLSSYTTDTLLSYITEPDRIKVWNKGVRNCEILVDHDSSWISHSVYDIPRVFSQQDLIAQHRITTDDTGIIIRSYAIPEYAPQLDDVHREEFNLSEWALVSSSCGQSTLTFRSVTLSNTSVPRWIKDPIIQNKMISSFSSLRKLTESL